MARTSANFQALLWDLARMQELEPDTAVANGGLTDGQEREVLLDLNRGYNRAYRFGEPWEDAWTSDTLTPTAGVITYAQLQNASQFSLWTEDPRPIGANAAAVAFKSSDAGIHPQVEGDIYAFWMPVCPRFTTTVYADATPYAVGAKVLASDGNCYECLQAGTGQDPTTEAAYWRELPVIEVLSEAVINLALSIHFTRTKQHGAAKQAEAYGLELLDNQAAIEFPRLQTWWWLRRQM